MILQIIHDHKFVIGRQNNDTTIRGWRYFQHTVSQVHYRHDTKYFSLTGQTSLSSTSVSEFFPTGLQSSLPFLCLFVEVDLFMKLFCGYQKEISNAG